MAIVRGSLLPLCTHTSMTRIFDDTGIERCTNCRRVPDFGFFYCCTQETNGNLPNTEPRDEKPTSTSTECNANLRPRKQSETPQATSATSCSHPPTNTPCSEAAATNQATHDNDLVMSDASAQEQESKHGLDETLSREQINSAIRKCGFKICPACRPSYKDRAWQSLNDIVRNPVGAPSQSELDNRRISSAALVARIQPRDSSRPSQDWNSRSGRSA